MKHFAMLLCLLLVAFGFVLVVFKGNPDGIVVMTVFTFAFLALGTSKTRSHNTFTNL
jgi:hypothetical protein